MNRVLMLLCCVFFLSILTGCQSPNSGVEVIIEDNGQFPEFLVGTWRAEGKSGWEFVFEPDGTISSAVISLGRVRIEPGHVTTVPMKMGGKSIFEPGEWMVNYSPAVRVLTVKISLKNFYAELGGGIVEGKSTDIFIGEVSEDGRTWAVDWTAFLDCVARTPEKPDFDLSTDLDYGESQTLIFEKVTPE